ncbi:MAG TPA: hypothetical protein VGE52_10855 [Pirellulales bacterium]
MKNVPLSRRFDLTDAPSSSFGQRSRPVLLVVSGDEVVRRTLVEMLEDTGCLCFAADNCKQALELAGEQNRLDAVFMCATSPDVEISWLTAELRDLHPQAVLVGAFDEPATLWPVVPCVDRVVSHFWDAETVYQNLPVEIRYGFSL